MIDLIASLHCVLVVLRLGDDLSDYFTSLSTCRIAAVGMRDLIA